MFGCGLSDGLLPTFEFDSGYKNIIAWNRIRLFLQTYDSHNFAKQQHTVTWILTIPLIVILGKLTVMLLGTSFNQALSAEADRWKVLVHHNTQSEMVDTMILKVILVLVLLFVQIYYMCVGTRVFPFYR
jgi:heme/copper-type cytochrome/quinol oxidase subunit 2